MTTADINTCRKCGSAELFTTQVNANVAEGPNLLPIGFWEYPTYQIVICGDCGLTDWFVSRKHLKAVKRKLKRVNPLNP